MIEANSLPETVLLATHGTIRGYQPILSSRRRGWPIAIRICHPTKAERSRPSLYDRSRFVRGRPSCLIRGDNIVHGHGLTEILQRANDRATGATVFGYRVDDPQRYGVIEFNERGEVLSVKEKPKNPKSNWAAIGIYFYDEDVIEIVRQVNPSARGEYEITDLNNLYIREKRLAVELLGRGFAWFDAGTHDSLLEAAEFVRVLQHRQGQLVASPEEIAFCNGWLTADEFNAIANRFSNTQ